MGGGFFSKVLLTNSRKIMPISILGKKTNLTLPKMLLEGQRGK
jgi:hypothetical protein